VVIAAKRVDDIARLETPMRTPKKRMRVAVAASGTGL
jgi:hypothetical protein